MDLVMWIVIGVVVVFALMFTKFDHIGRQVKVVLFILIGLFIFFSVTNMFSGNDYDLMSPQGIVNSVGVYFSWVSGVFVNLWDVGAETVTAVGHAIKLNETIK